MRDRQRYQAIDLVDRADGPGSDRGVPGSVAKSTPDGNFAACGICTRGRSRAALSIGSRPPGSAIESLWMRRR